MSDTTSVGERRAERERRQGTVFIEVTFEVTLDTGLVSACW
jgi:hypothetical protein